MGTKIKLKIIEMIQTKEELFIAELGGNPQQEIELSYGAKIKITDLLSKYLEAMLSSAE